MTRKLFLRIPSDVRECDASPSPISKAGPGRTRQNWAQPFFHEINGSTSSKRSARIIPNQPSSHSETPSPPLNLRRIPAYSSLGLLRRRGALYHFQLRIEACPRLHRVLIPICDYSIGYGHSGPPLCIESRAPTQPSVNGQAKFDWREGISTVQVKTGQTDRTVST